MSYSTDFEFTRAEALRRYEILDSEPEKEFDGLTLMASRICEAPLALISLADGERLWFKSKVGTDMVETTLDQSVCRYALEDEGEIFIVNDLTLDSRFRELPLVEVDSGFRFYAGVPIETPEHIRLGMLCVLDREPRELTPLQTDALAMLAKQVMNTMELSLSRRRLRRTVESIRGGLVNLNEEYRITYLNFRAAAMLGIETRDALGKDFRELCGSPVNQPLPDHPAGAVAGSEGPALEFFREATGMLLDLTFTSTGEDYAVFLRDITAQREVEERNRLLETCIDRVNDIILVTEADPIDEPGPRIVYVNEAFERLTGYRSEDVIGKSPRFLHGAATQRDCLDRIREGLAAKRPCREEIINYTKEGEAFWLEIEIVPVFDSRGKVTHFVAVERDVTPRKREEVERLRMVRNLNQRIKELTAIHETAKLLRGKSLPPELLLENVAHIIVNAMQESTVAAHLSCGGHQYFHAEFRETPSRIDFVAKSPEGLEVRVQAASLDEGSARNGRDPFFSEERDMVASIGEMLLSHFSILQGREELHNSERRYRSLFANNPHPMWVYDVETLRFLDVNAAAVAKYGYSLEEFLSMTLRDIRPSEDIPRLEKSFERLSGGFSHAGIWNHCTKDGRLIRVDISSYLSKSGFRGRQEELVLALDVTERIAAETALRESEARLARSQKIAQLGSWEVILETGTLFWSDETLRIFGLDPDRETLTYEGYLAALHPSDRERVLGIVEQILAAGEGGFDMDHRIVRPDGEVRWVQGIGELQTDENGEAISLAGSVLDITERKLSEHRIRENEERQRLLALATNDAIWEWEIADDTLVWTEGYETLFGRRRDEVDPTLKSWTDYIHPDDEERVLSILHEATDTELVDFEAEYRFRHADGHYCVVYDCGHVMRDAEGKPIRMIGGMSDLTERKRAEDRLREQAALLDKARDAILVRGLDHRILYWNAGAEQLYGWKAEEALGQSIAELLYDRPEAFEEATKAVMQKGEWTGEIAQVDRDGKQLTVDCSWTLMRDEDGQPKTIFAINTDMTERRNLERQFLRTQRMESLGTLAGGIAHDLNNVLTPIIMAADLLSSQEQDAKTLGLIQAIDTSARRGADMVKQVLAFGRGVDGQRLDLDIGELVGEVIKIVLETFPKNIVVKEDIADDLWPIKGDSTQLHQVLLNLAVNARDAMPRGGSLTFSAANLEIDELYVATTPGAVVGPHVLVSVEDTGTGMPPDVLERIFEPFFTTKELGKGTGLGLSTSMAIVKSHGGFVRPYSELGKGTRFRLYIPAQSREMAGTRIDESEELRRGAGETILLVDDEAVIRDITRQVLEAFGYKVLTALDGADAISVYAANHEKIDLVLTDLMMPVMDGPAMIQVLLRIQPDVRIIAASGLNANGHVAEAEKAGIKDFISKPYNASLLLKMVHDVIHADP